MDIEIIYGPPGTGKTTKLMSILEEELKTNDPDRIAYVSFTKQGAYEGRDRAMSKFGFSKDDFPFFRTLHSIAFRNLNMSRSAMMSPYNYKQFSEALAMKFTGYYTEEFFHSDDRYLFFDILYRNNPKIAADYLEGLNIKTLNFVRENYKAFKEQLGLKDFTDLIESFCKNQSVLPVDIAIIDEAQDLTTLQWRMIWTSFKNCKKIYIAGDDDQAIYEWSGADVSHLLRIKGKQTILNKSYRLPEKVQKYSKTIVELISQRVTKRFDSSGNTGEIKIISSLEELDIDNENSWLFLSRNNKFLKIVEEYLQSKGIIYLKKGKKSANMNTIKAIQDYEKLRKGEYNKKEHIYKVIDYVDQECDFKRPWYEEFNLPDEQVTYYRDLFAAGVDFNSINVRVETIHSSKGSEADNVVLINDLTYNVKTNLLKNADSEIRCYYVGITRTKNKLYLMTPQTKYSYDFMPDIKLL